MKSNLVKKTFNKAAGQYDSSCELQLKTGKVLLDLLKKYHINSSSILDAGCGTGIVTKKLANAFDYHDFFAVDIADQLLAKAKEKLPSNIQVEFMDYHDIHREFDMIYANLSLHWSADFSSTLCSMHKKLNEDGVFVFSIPLIGTFEEIKNYCAIHAFLDSSEVKTRLSNAGFNLIHAKNEIITFEFDNLINALKSIKAVGTNYVAKKNSEKKTHLKKYIRSNNPVRLSYHIGYFVVK